MSIDRERVLDVLDRAHEGPVYKERDFNMRVIPQAIGKAVKKYGLANTCDREEPGNCGCLHSEENAVINCDAPRETKKFVLVTHLPCAACAKRLMSNGLWRWA